MYASYTCMWHEIDWGYIPQTTQHREINRKGRGGTDLKILISKYCNQIFAIFRAAVAVP